MNQPDAAEIEPDAMERVVQEAIEEWATIHGGPRPDDVPLAHYITAKVRHALTGWRTDPEAAAALRQPREGAENESRELLERYREALKSIRDGGHEASAARKATRALGDDAPFDPWCPYCGADAYVSGCVEGCCYGALANYHTATTEPGATGEGS